MPSVGTAPQVSCCNDDMPDVYHYVHVKLHAGKTTEAFLCLPKIVDAKLHVHVPKKIPRAVGVSVKCEGMRVPVSGTKRRAK